MSKYIDAEKLIAKIERRKNQTERRLDNIVPIRRKDTMDEEQLAKIELRDKVDKSYLNGVLITLSDILSFIASLQQEQPEGNLEYWLEHFGMPKENIDYCINQIAQGYGACRYLEGVRHGAEAVNELAQQEQPEVDSLIRCELPDMEDDKSLGLCYCNQFGNHRMTKKDVREIARHFYELGLNARKEE